ncbi:MAG: Mbeg1-like protein [Streptococcus sp.]
MRLPSACLSWDRYSVIGWKEDFQLTYSREIPAHRSAIAFRRSLPNLSGHIAVSDTQGWQSCPLFGCSEFDCLREQIAGFA